MRPEMPSIRVSRRGKILIGVLVSLLVILSLLGSLASVYTNWLWFGEVGFRRVYSTILVTRIVLFLIVGIVLAVIIGANVYLAYRLRPPFRPMSQEQENLERYRVALEPRKRLAFSVLVGLIFLIAGASGQANWKIWQLWRNGVSFGVKDAQFHRDISFFAWDYPFYRMILGLAFNAVIFSLLLSLAVHYVFGAFRIATPGPKLTIAARRHVTLLVFFFIALKACAYWLDRYGLVFSGRGKVTGASYTDVHASLPAKTILFWIAILIALSVLASLWLKSAQLPVIGFVVLIVLSLGISGIYPFFMQQFTVKPNANVKESPYISRNIAATRQAYGIVTNTGTSSAGTVSYKTYDAVDQPSTTALVSTDPTIDNLRILDPNVVSPTFTKFQQVRNVYGFADKLDIDRYTIKNQEQDYVVGVRELDRTNLTGNQTNWISLHTLYTHGDGFVAAAASSDVTNTKNFTEGDLPADGPLNLTTPQIYYGEKLPDYSIVGAQGTAREYDGIDQRTTYAGSGGIKLSNLFTRLAFAVKYKESNFVLNDVVSAQGAKLIFNRDPRQRVQKVAPFLTVDGDPYPAVINGRVVWMLDGYTTIANYPYSERQSLSDLTSDSLTATNRTAAQANSDINYIRNSVKATVDAYTGQVTLYQWDDTDPVLKTWMKVFPNLIKPKADLVNNANLLAHVRYPQDLFEVQRSLLEQYHVDDPSQFYSSSDKWTVPNDPNLTNGSSAPQPPYYVLASDPAVAAGQPQFQLTTPMKVNNSTYLAAYISVDSDPGPDYGKMTVLKIASKAVIQGPEQIANTFKSTPAISKDISLLDSGGSSVLHGNMLTLPIGDSFMYVEPLYVQASGDQAYPILRRVQVAYGDKVGYAASLSEALANLSQSVVGQSLTDTGGTSSSTPPSSSAPPTGSSSPSSSPSGSSPPTPPSTATPGENQLLTQLNTAFDQLQAAYKTGDLAKIGAAQADVQRLTQAYVKARASASASPSK